MEWIQVIRHESYDPDGNLIEDPHVFTPGNIPPGFNVLPGGIFVQAVVGLADTGMEALPSTEAVHNRLVVYMPPGVRVEQGDVVRLMQRGEEEYTVVSVPFDWSVGRRPVNPRHKPKLAITVERKEA